MTPSTRTTHARRNVLLSMALAAACLAPQLLPAAHAQATSYPSKPVRFVVPFTPGGSNDALARAVGQKLGEYWGQAVVVDNRPGAGGNLGAREVAKAPADGYTFLIVANSFVINPPLYGDGRAGYDPIKEFAPVAQLGVVPVLLVTRANLSVKSVQDLVKLAKVEPGRITYASAGIGTPHHLTAEMFSSMAGVKMVHVPYKGAVPAVTDLVGGQVDVLFGVANSVLPFIRSGAIKAVATGGAKRLSYLPDVPTVAESGLPGFNSEIWVGLVAPAGTPADIVTKVSQAVTKALADPGVKEKLASQGLEPAPSTPAELATIMKTDLDRWSAVIRETGARAE
ncbi:tripartite tricarboxylate transporter substrate binding protein [soil metagenome]